MKKKILKIVSVYLALNLLAQIFAPTVALALTGGPSQPEVESFEPVGTTEMVDLFSGDFNYNIPLLTVPGPNGGYPINLAYHAGIGMEQEASWVGLGWNINPGVINRQLRGLPDDFNGDMIKKSTAMKPQVTVGLDWSKELNEVEKIGFEFTPDVSSQIYFNNYKGLGFGLGLSLSEHVGKVTGSHFSPALELSYSTDGGIGVAPSLSWYHAESGRATIFNVGLDYNSREGLQSIHLGAERRAMEKEKMITGYDDPITGETHDQEMTANRFRPLMSHRGAGVTFSGASFVPNVTTSMSGMNLRAGIILGNKNNITDFKKKKPTRLKGSYVMNWVKHEDQFAKATPSYGYLYSSQGSTAGESVIMDLNREKDVPVTKDAPSLPIPVFTHDVYCVKGQGIGSIYRPYRNDVGMLSENTVTSEIGGGNFTLEAGGGSAIHLGADAGINASTSYSGDWSDPDFYKELDQLDFKVAGSNTGAGEISNYDFEPFYFKASGEQTTEVASFLTDYFGEDPVRFNLGLRFSGASFKPKVKDELTSPESSSVAARNNSNKLIGKQKRVQYIQMRKRTEIVHNSSAQSNLYSLNTFPSGGASASAYSYSGYDSQIGELTAINPDGNRYVYGIPAYNNEQKEVVFSLDGTNTIPSMTNADLDDKTRSYISQDVSTTNDKGSDHYFSKTETPPYAHSFLITSILSPDYVDLTGDGPSNDDLGYYVKFNYSVISGYKWRIPFTKANNILGHLSNVTDDKAAFTYGEKDIYYLNSVETKTHVAEFVLNNTDTNPRQDGYGAYEENNGFNSTIIGQAQRYLDKILLYSKNCTNYGTGSTKTPIKTVHFSYDYSLCKYTENNSTLSTTHGGKLTLKKVWFTYLDNDKGELSPYKFDYHEDSSTWPEENPDYNVSKMDRWGNYQADSPTNGFVNEENPFVNQSTANKSIVDRNAAVWSLKEITLPSGGVITVDYEADDYSCVQEKRAMQMMRLYSLNTSDTTTTTAFGKKAEELNGAVNESTFISDGKGKVYFLLETPFSGTPTTQQQQDIMDEYLEGVEKLYFKVFTKLKTQPLYVSEKAYDYVKGYAEIVPLGDQVIGTDYGLAQRAGDSDYKLGYFTVKPVKVNDAGGALVTHPFRKAGWQYLKMQRPDLFQNSNNAGTKILDAFVQLLTYYKDGIKLLTQFYNFCNLSGYCNRYVRNPGDADYYRPSYIRLNSPDKIKCGGGHRVKKLSIDDKWGTITDDATGSASSDVDFSYGQEFTYTMPDGTSSGVAEYEPLVGGEEIPHHLPVRFSNDKFLVNDKALYLEEPYCESYFPSASVGYGRVTARSLKRTESGSEVNKLTAAGFTVNEFYTARDFPVNVYKTSIDLKKYVWPIKIPFLGTWSFNNKGYSQGYRIELNDMHGKPKAIATYSSNASLVNPGQPVTKVEYNYLTTADFQDNYSTGKTNRLSSVVDVLDGDGNYRSTTLGRTSDLFIDRRENSNISLSTGVQPNAEVSVALALPSVHLYVNYSEAMFRSIVTNKVVNKTGILSEVKQYDNGASITTKNLMFDSETGKPLLTKVTNEFNKEVYHYSMPAQWANDRMGPAYKNTDVKIWTFSTQPTAYDEYLCTNASKYFNVGDEIEVNISGTRTRYWISSIPVADDRIVIIKEDGSAPTSQITGGIATVVRSARTNQQSVDNASIVALDNPVTQRDFPLFDLFNTAIYGQSSPPTTLTGHIDCNDESSVDVLVSLGGDNRTVSFSKSSGPCASYASKVIFPAGVLSTYNDLKWYSLTKTGSVALATSGTTTYTCKWEDQNNCFPECMEKVLHADATEFSSDWTYNYTDVGTPMVSGTALSTKAAANGYRYGTKNIWRVLQGNAYLIDREQQSSPGTDISKDGTYKEFTFFNWGQTSYVNTNWAKVTQVTRYSPYGFELENKDALGNYSSALYGYNNSLVTAVSKNAPYFETAFDGFEDYPGATYGSAGHGHFNLSGASISSSASHTGSYGITLAGSATTTYTVSVGASNPDYFTPLASQKYMVSAWFKPGTPGTTPQITVSGGGVSGSPTVTVDPYIIEGWQRVDVVFTTASSGTVSMALGFPSGGGYVDDVRAMPFKSAITTYVYDPKTLWLIAELDNRNYATFYNYDEQGALVQVKKETVNGIVTIKTSRNNIKQ